MDKRVPELDIIRAGTALAVIAIHVTAGYMAFSFGYYWNHLVRFAVPLFIMLSGLVLCWNDLGREFQPASLFYKKRVQKIVVPYVVWTLIYCLVNAYLLRWHDLQLFLSNLAQSLIWGSAQYHLYFLTIIIQMYLLYPFLRRWMTRSPRSLLVASLILTVICQVLHYFNLLSIITLPPQYAPLYLRAFPVWIFYFTYGMFAADHLKTMFQRDQDALPVSFLGLAWLGCLVLMVLDSKLTSIYVSIVRPSVIIYTLSSYYFFIALARKWGNRLDYLFGWFSIQSFLVYLMHPLVLTGLEITARRLGQPDLWAGNMGLIFFYMTVVMVTILATYIISLTPAAILLGGMRMKK